MYKRSEKLIIQKKMQHKAIYHKRIVKKLIVD
jgi:hypothetical protein